MTTEKYKVSFEMWVRKEDGLESDDYADDKGLLVDLTAAIVTSGWDTYPLAGWEFVGRAHKLTVQRKQRKGVLPHL